MYLKSKKKDVKIILADPPGSVLYSYFKTGKLERTVCAVVARLNTFYNFKFRGQGRSPRALDKVE